MTLSGAVGSG